MNFKIRHLTRYNFSEKVFFEPHQFRFKPRNSKHIELKSFDIEIFPAPTGLSTQFDIENNFIHFGWFEGMHTNLEVRAEFELVSLDFNPFDFLVYPLKYDTLPFQYADDFGKIVLPYLENMNLDSGLVDFANNVEAKSKKTVDFIMNITREIHEKFEITERFEGETYHPDESFHLKKGSCRDVAWMQIHLLRHFGIAARFVSGYCFLGAEESQDYELHAWCEAYIPGAGWIGFDPSHGILTGSNYIPITSSAHYSNTMPVAGSVRGGAKSELITDLKIEVFN